jgi:hypothetical protein
MVSGDGYVGADEISAGTVANGTVEIKKGSYSVTTFKSGAPDSGYASTTSTITLTRNPPLDGCDRRGPGQLRFRAGPDSGLPIPDICGKREGQWSPANSPDFQ